MVRRILTAHGRRQEIASAQPGMRNRRHGTAAGAACGPQSRGSISRRRRSARHAPMPRCSTSATHISNRAPRVEGRFDVAIAIFFLHHLPDAELMALPHRLRRQLTPGGVFYSLDPSRQRLSGTIGRLLIPTLMKRYQTDDERELGAEETASLFRAAGWKTRGVDVRLRIVAPGRAVSGMECGLPDGAKAGRCDSTRCPGWPGGAATLN